MSADREPDERGRDSGPERLPDAASGEDAARSALGRARDAARARGLRPGASVSAAGAAARRRAAADARSGAHPDARDPQLLTSSIDDLVSGRGWGDDVAVGSVVGRWDAVVGPEIATHCAPVSFADGVLTVRAESTAWATQLRLLSPVLQARLVEALGEEVVSSLMILGPAAPSWRRGGRVAPGGVGPRDTYG